MQLFQSTFDKFSVELISSRCASRGGSFEFTCLWTPSNPYLGLNALSTKKHYTSQPNSIPKAHLEQAKKGEETDITLVSNEGAKIHAHSLYLKACCDYFDKMFATGMKESKEKIANLNFPTKTLENLQQFIYLGVIDPSLHKDLSELLELLALSKEILFTNLHNHIIDLINDYIATSDSLNKDQVEAIFQAALLYDVQDFIKPCLVAAEKLEKKSEEGEESVEWDKIKPGHYVTLLIIAVKNSLGSTKQKLAEAINKKMK